MHRLVNVVKTAALEAIEEGKPTSIVFGTVVSTTPLKIDIELKEPLNEEFLVLTHNVLDYHVDISVSHNTVNDAFMDGAHTHAESLGDTTDEGSLDTTHHHAYKGRKRMLIHNGLHVGEKVMLIQAQGGQKYIVLDRVENPHTSGEWLE